MSKQLKVISRPQQLSVTMALLRKQNGVCPLCGEHISVAVKGKGSDYALDHDHNTGEIRGVLHRGCNSAEGKVRSAVMRWGKCGNNEDKIVNFIIQLGQYLQEVKDGSRSTGIMYPNHKSAEEKAAAAKVKANKAAAIARAKKRAAQLKQDSE